MLLALIGAAVGVLVALPVARMAGGLLYGVSATDPLTYAGITYKWKPVRARKRLYVPDGDVVLDPIRPVVELKDSHMSRPQEATHSEPAVVEEVPELEGERL